MAQEIMHDGRIESITPKITTVRFVSRSACSSCHAAGLCGASDMKEKSVEVPTTAGNWQVGQEVTVCLGPKMGMKAVLLAYALPLAVLVAVLLALVGAGLPEWVAGLCAIAATLLYFAALRLFKGRLTKEYAFYIKEKQ